MGDKAALNFTVMSGLEDCRDNRVNCEESKATLRKSSQIHYSRWLPRWNRENGDAIDLRGSGLHVKESDPSHQHDDSSDADVYSFDDDVSEEEDITGDDLRQENDILRNEIQNLYIQIATNTAIAPQPDGHVSIGVNTDENFHGQLDIEQDKVSELELELNAQKLFNVQQAQRGKELEQEIREYESKILEMNLTAISMRSVQTKLDGVMQAHYQLQAELSTAKNRNMDSVIEKNRLEKLLESQSQEIEAFKTTVQEQAAALESTKAELKGNYDTYQLY